MEDNIYSKLITDNINMSYSINSKKRIRYMNEYIKMNAYWNESKYIRLFAILICLAISIFTFFFASEGNETVGDIVLSVMASLVMFLMFFMLIYVMCVVMIRIKCSDGMMEFKNIHILFGVKTLYIIKQNFSENAFEIEKISYVEEIKYDGIQSLIYNTKTRRLDIVGNYKTTRICQRLRGIFYGRTYGVRGKRNSRSILMAFDSNHEIFELLNEKCKCKVTNL